MASTLPRCPPRHAPWQVATPNTRGLAGLAWGPRRAMENDERWDDSDDSLCGIKTYNTCNHNESQWVTMSHNESQWVTMSHNESQWVTMSHNESQWVTMSHNDHQRVAFCVPNSMECVFPAFSCIHWSQFTVICKWSFSNQRKKLICWSWLSAKCIFASFSPDMSRHNNAQNVFLHSCPRRMYVWGGFEVRFYSMQHLVLHIITSNTKSDGEKTRTHAFGQGLLTMFAIWDSKVLIPGGVSSR